MRQRIGWQNPLIEKSERGSTKFLKYQLYFLISHAYYSALKTKRRNFINTCCGKIMCPNMTVAPLDKLDENGGFYGMQQPKMVVVVVNKAPPPRFFNMIATATKDFVTPTYWMTTTTTPAPTTTTSAEASTTTTKSPLTHIEVKSIIVTDASATPKFLYNCTADVSTKIPTFAESDFKF